ncbi:MFS transporter [Rhodococcus tibetensis]|uniref:MFS transporter n=1 Tax=Rhodococcus tibetensis TaxID=2965064 RepID=A0ABT1QFA7_9NOCA|nr:MFS transporter [Rhodococcus sp. FXJ9.536]MCQ4120872.1 MFS transporter [Rhodococcus sp. FXJ9.536]
MTVDASQAPNTSGLGARLDRIPVATSTLRMMMILVGFFYLFDAVDIVVFGNTVPAMREQWGLSVNDIALGSAAPFVGMFIGAIVGGQLADRFGRRRIILGSTVLYSVCCLATAFAPTYEVVVVLRGLTGLGLQALVGAVMVYASELLPAHIRGRYLAIIAAVGAVAVPVTAVASRIIVPLGDEAWRWMYVFGSLGILGIVTGYRRLPESPRWQVARGRPDLAETLVATLEAEAVAATGAPLPPPRPERLIRTGSARELFSRRYVRRTVVASAAMACFVLLAYGWSPWLPSLLTGRGYTQAEALTFVSVLGVASVAGALTSSLLIDRWDRKNYVFVLTVLLAVLLFVFAATGNRSVMLVVGFAISMLIHALLTAVYTYAPEVFPTHLRGIGNGVVNGVGRIAGIGGPFIVAAVYSAFDFGAVFVYLAVVGVVLGLGLMLFGEQTTNRSLEDIAADAGEAELSH